MEAAERASSLRIALWGGHEVFQEAGFPVFQPRFVPRIWFFGAPI